MVLVNRTHKAKEEMAMLKYRTVGRVVLATLAAVLAANVAMAMPIVTTTWFSDNFDTYTNNTRLRLASTNWQGTLSAGPENYVLNNGGMQYSSPEAVRLRGRSNTGTDNTPTYSETKNSVAALSAGMLQILDFKLKAPDAAHLSMFDHAGIYMLDASGAAIAGWVGDEHRMKAKYTRPAGTEGTEWDFPDTAYHDFEVAYDPATGVTNWYIDGALNQTYTLGTGKAVAYILVQDVITNNGGENNLWLDNIVLGTPEPATLVLLGLGGLFLLRRR
jgi:hypothetical protein